MLSLTKLSEEQLAVVYQLAQEEGLEEEFIEMIEGELERRESGK
ncbi:sporulation histidine kinase inhibitor Sda [Rossellomorea sp. AcN35-11]|nr:sporulation histidine kinase inhibitor Sda [Rossellomorea aquimaris]NMH70673.1 sporulation histidine kinase inhibitor Sda [Bacillus sp. RO3]WJV30626.1 sporulation histidine kinase inhibitor Sda [Rossellomorea sp. AcN35-11]